MYRKIKPSKITEQRGTRTRKAIAELTGGQISEQQIGQYEKGQYKPSERTLPYLLAALGCTYEDISDAVDLVVA